MTRINNTRDYHRHGRIDLMTEFTISESLRSTDSLYSKALKMSSSYGAMVGRKLAGMDLLKPGCRVCEVGGGYGSLMGGLLDTYAAGIRRVTMIDLSRHLLERQRARLKPWGSKVAFVQGDISELIHSLRGVDLMILNEVIGDLDTWMDLSAREFPGDIARFIRDYNLDIPEKGKFHINIGALRLLEEICRKGIPSFICEHSSDPIIPPGMDYLARGMALDGFPREIRLKDHSEYTIRFSHLVRIAEVLGREVRTGPLLELLGIGDTPGLRFIFTARASAKDEQGVILEFLDHVREYRWMVVSGE
ncbi:MAG TPA: class I SAM-dependent methyltransferase [Syntrophales bacterium]|nr:class I SAM-dependent methyltransferase [Syntrophales bacterium]HPI56015.1 class I SAM-dependent methyltransferase [Syntrophales bacterium]HPN24095.1 class I SAM-dependent methyltransferase [Syntrophales bacterium]